MNTTQTQVRSTEEALSVFDTLKLALEALKHGVREMNMKGCALECMPLHDAITAIQEVLAQPEAEAQEPYAIETGFDNGDGTYSVRIERLPLRTTPHKDWRKHEKLLYTTPPQRKPLTDEGIDAAIKCAKKVDTGYAGWVRDQRREFARAIEAAHGIYAPSERRPTDFKE